MQFRIGDRDPVSGLYDVIYPDGSHTRNGIKIFNSAHEFGDVVLATQRSDGMMILDGVKATLTEVVTNSFSLGGFGEKPVGYLAGQVFNNEDEVILPVVSVKFAPGSPTSLAPNAGSFVVRISIDRPQRKDLKIKCELTGTAPVADYTYVGLDVDKFAIVPAGLLFKDVTITPISNTTTTTTNETVVIKALILSIYRIGADNIATAIIIDSAVTLKLVQLCPAIVTPGNGQFFRVDRLGSTVAAISVQIDVFIIADITTSAGTIAGYYGDIINLEILAGEVSSEIATYKTIPYEPCNGSIEPFLLEGLIVTASLPSASPPYVFISSTFEFGQQGFACVTV
jgi:hypothetical protein